MNGASKKNDINIKGLQEDLEKSKPTNTEAEFCKKQRSLREKPKWSEGCCVELGGGKNTSTQLDSFFKKACSCIYDLHFLQHLFLTLNFYCSSSTPTQTFFYLSPLICKILVPILNLFLVTLFCITSIVIQLCNSDFLQVPIPHPEFIEDTLLRQIRFV